ncbi:hypothetical protein [Nocardia mangyaensis]|uniref:hypothetical protein n=1 Tax=Nocardia mangyaensis TaxID=2213200 RepID=UPI002676A43B|nr:hypothetical protein [Nocardia mangyaensis]MDO3651218.1 hypothetical protein [Nocardia mangyaensis]
MGAWVGADRETVALAKRILDSGLVRRVLEIAQSAMIDHTGISGIAESGRGVRPREVVADLTKILWTQRLSRGGGKETEMVTERVGGVVRQLVGGQTQVGGAWIRGELDIHEELVAAEQAAAIVERGIDRRLNVLPGLVQFGR